MSQWELLSRSASLLMAQYGRSEYWDERYTRDPEPFDWYQRWAGLKDVIKCFSVSDTVMAFYRSYKSM